MARLPRFIIPGQPQHVIIRGNNRSDIFCEDQDYYFYLGKLKEACIKHQCDIHAYVLMTNHIHLLITPKTEQGISKLVQMMGRYYVQYFNYTYQRTGTLWEGRYKATLIDSENYLLTCQKYIELNPVRAGMVSHPSEYVWSSYGVNAQGLTNHAVTSHFVYQRLGRSVEDRRLAYRCLFNEKISNLTLKDIRDSTNKGWVLGDKKFKSDIKNLSQRRVSPTPRGGSKRKILRIEAISLQ